MSTRALPGTAAVQPLLLREREAAIALGVSGSQIGIWRREGRLTPVRLPGLRAVRYSRAEIEALACRWCREAGVQEPAGP